MRRTKRKCDNIKELIINHINNNRTNYLILSLLFISGIIFGVICINNTKEQQKQELTGYITNFFETLKNDEYGIDYMKYLKISVIQNLKICVIMGLTSSTVVGIFAVYSITIYKGFCMRIYNFFYNINFRNWKRNFDGNNNYVISKFNFNTSYFCDRC